MIFGRLFRKTVNTPQLPLYFYDSLTREKRVFTPADPHDVKMYSCGPTVYDHAHIGNLRAYLLSDLIKRALIYNKYTVRHIINFTDFGHLTDDGDEGEDKMMKALKRENLPISLTAMKEIAQRYMQSFKEDMTDFRNLPPTQYTPASEFIKEQKRLIETLLEKGYAYSTRDGVYYDISKFPTYGALGNIHVDDQSHGARVTVNPNKRNPADFALWKRGLLGWDSPWGKGFPGWHIECTAMGMSTLGKFIDIHTGGEDLMYTHHNGEIAQAEAILGKPYIGYWMHNAHLNINNTKIAKSAGNSIRLSQLYGEGFSPTIYRYWLLTSHYRTTTNFSFDVLKGAKTALFKLRRFIIEEGKNSTSGVVHEKYRLAFHTALNDDLDTPRIIALIWDIYKDTSLSIADRIATIREIDSVLQIGLNDSRDELVKELGIIADQEIPDDIRALIDARSIARTTRNWEESDRLRDALNLRGFIVEDTPTGQKITRTAIHP